MVADARVEQAIQQSVQGFPPVESVKAGATYGWGYYLNGGARDLIAAYGSLQCDVELKRFYRRVYNTIAQGTIAGVSKRIASTPFEIKSSKSSRSLANRFTEMLQYGQYGMGWTDLIKMTIADYAILNRGATWEVIAPGDPTKEIDYANIVGLAIKDGLRCFPTGHPEYPVVYRGKWLPEKRDYMYFALHKTRCMRFVDMPDSDEDLFGVGMSALYRVIGTAYVQILMQKYQVEKLSDLPPQGFMTISGMTEDQVRDAMRMYELDRQAEGQAVFRNLVRLSGFNPDMPPQVNITPFSAAPENFNYKEYMDMHVNLFALAFGVDKQEIWELTSGNLGTGTQSQILHAKSQGKFYGDCMTMIERAVNQALPPSLTFAFKWKDPQQDKELAERANVWMGIVTLGANIFSKEQQLKLLANNVEQFADVLLNEDGELELGDAETPAQAAPINPEIAQPTPAQAQPIDAEIRDEIVTDDMSKATVRKEWSSTVDSYVSDVKDAITAGNDGDVTRRRFGTLMRGLLQRYGSQAFRDGMEASGVVEDTLDSDALTQLMNWQADQSGYVTDFANKVYKDGLSDAGIDSHARMWGNKSLRAAWDLGLAYADADPMMEFVIGKTEAHCTDCLALNGVRMKKSKWASAKKKPKSSALKCGGFKCDCDLKRVRGRARGSAN